MIVEAVMEHEPLNTTIPAWKLEIIKNRRKNKSSASFSHYDRTNTRTVRHEETSQNGLTGVSSVKTQDIINFFNKSTDVARVNLSSSRSFSSGHQHRLVVNPRTKTEPGRGRDSDIGMFVSSRQLGQVSDDRTASTSASDDVLPGPSGPGQCVALGQLRAQLTLPEQARPPTGSLSRSLAESQVTLPVVAGQTRYLNNFSANNKIQRSVSFSVVSSHHQNCVDGNDDDYDFEDEMIWEQDSDYSDRYPTRSSEDSVEILLGDHMNMGEDTRLFISNGGAEARSRVTGGGVGARLYRGRQTNKRNTGRGGDGGSGPGGDSDGMMGSGGDSDSSEEIHYGPGFVSRLKSRYMSVALRGSPRGTLGTLRRTASLEYFLDCDKECDVEEVELTTPPPRARASGNNEYKIPSKKESMKRAQSVEVLSLLQTDKPAVPAAPSSAVPQVLPYTYFDSNTLDQPPPCESPPPLPPRESPSVHNTLSHPALAADIIIAEKQPPPKVLESTHPKPFKPQQASNSANAKTKQHSNAKSLAQSKRASSGVLFGVKDKELPAPDIVKQTRKLFEGNPGSGGSRRFGTSPRSGGLTKAKSTSSLYTKPPSRSSSFEAPLTRNGRKKSEEDLSQRPPFLNSGSPSRKYSRTNSSPARTPKLPTKPGQNNTTPRPALPAKPSHLSPMVSGKPSVMDRNVQKVTPTKKLTNTNRSNGANRVTSYNNNGIVKASLATVIPDADVNKQDANVKDLETKSIQLNLRPINSQNDSENICELGTKRVSPETIQSIRNSGNHVNFKFDDKSNSNVKTHLPGKETKKPLPPKQVGVIRPISRDIETRDSVTSARSAVSAPHVNRNNKINKIDKNLNDEKKETLIIEKDPLFVPIDTWRENNTQAKNYINKKIHSETVREAPHVIVSGVKSSDKSPPSVPPRNGSKLEHGEVTANAQKKYFDSNIEPQNNKASDNKVVVKSEPKAVKTSAETDVTDKSNYRDSWKSRNDVQNTLVFNFVNSKGVVLLDSNGESHDGDSSEADDDKTEPVECSNNFVFVGAEIRTGKSSIRSRQSKRKLNITFNDKTEVFEYPSFESSVDTDTKKKDADEEIIVEVNNSKQQSSSIFKSNSSVGSSGGLGSYTPSKIQMSESSFQLGMQRSSPSSTTPASSSSSTHTSPETILLPADDGVSWGSAASSDMLF